MNVEEINKYINMLVGNLSFTMDYNSLVNGSKRLLIVEGQTDKQFIEKILNEDVVCIVANKAFGAQRGFGQEMTNCKSAIMRVVYGMSKIPMLIKCPKAAVNWTVFGMIDLDFDNPSGEYMSSPRLFVTDTHDLETLLLSTDDALLQKIDKCVIPVEDARKAFYLSYQLGIIRQVLYDANNSELTLKPLSPRGTNGVDYASFLDGYEVDLRKLVGYLNEKNDNCLSVPKEKKLFEAAIKDKRIKKKLDNNGKWNSSWDQFEASKLPDFWEVVNGHDILSILKFVNQATAEKYINRGPYSLNREFEMDLIDKYEYAMLEETKMYKDMRAEDVVTDI